MKTIASAATESRQHVSSSLNELLARAQAILSLTELRLGDLSQHTFKTSLSAASDIIGEAQAGLVYVFNGVFSVETITATNDRLCKAKAVISLMTDTGVLDEDAAELVCSAAINFLRQAMESMDAEGG